MKDPSLPNRGKSRSLRSASPRSSQFPLTIEQIERPLFRFEQQGFRGRGLAEIQRTREGGLGSDALQFFGVRSQLVDQARQVGGKIAAPANGLTIELGARLV